MYPVLGQQQQHKTTKTLLYYNMSFIYTYINLLSAKNNRSSPSLSPVVLKKPTLVTEITLTVVYHQYKLT